MCFDLVSYIPPWWRHIIVQGSQLTGDWTNCFNAFRLTRNKKIKTQWPFVRGFLPDQWIPLTMGQRFRNHFRVVTYHFFYVITYCYDSLQRFKASYFHLPWHILTHSSHFTQDIEATWTLMRLKLPATRPFVKKSVRLTTKIQTPHLCWESTGHKGQ